MLGACELFTITMISYDRWFTYLGLNPIFFLLFAENEQDMYGGFQGFNNFFPGQGPEGPGNMNFMVPGSQSTPPHGMDPAMRARG